MTSSIGSVPAGRGAGEAIAPTAASASSAASAAAVSGASQAKPVEAVGPPDPVTAGVGGSQASEAVTLSADAQATAQLLGAARAADGVDTARVSQLRQSLQDGGYDVKPEDVAKAISSAFGTGGGAVPGRFA